MSRLTVSPSSLMALAMLGACAPLPGTDAGLERPDGGTSVDAGKELDAGFDGGAEVDAGVDAGTDGGGSEDAGSVDDAGVGSDAGLPLSWRAVPIHFCRPGVAWSLDLNAFVDGPPARQFSVSSSAPPGLALDSMGRLAGTPTIAGTFTFDAHVTDGRSTARTSVAVGVDGMGPTLPMGLLVQAHGGALVLTWQPSTDDLSGVEGYRVLRDGARLAFVPGTTFTDVTLSPGVMGAYQLEAFDRVGNRSGMTVVVPAIGPLTDGGAGDGGLTIDAGSTDAGGAIDAGPFGPPPMTPITMCTYFVSPSGADTNDGRSMATPFRTLSAANSVVRPGDSVCLRSGTHAGPLRPAVSGTAAQRIHYAAYDREVATVRGGSENAADLNGRTFVTLSNLAFDMTTQTDVSAVNLDFASNVTMRHCRVERTTPIFSFSGPRQIGVSVEGTVDTLLEGNVIRFWAQGIQASRARRLTVSSNVVTNNFANGIVIAKGDGTLRGVLIEGNLFASSLTSDGVQTDDYTAQQQTVVAVRGVVIRRNVFVFNAENAIDLKAGGDVLVEGNLVVATLGDNDGSGFVSETEWWRERGQPAVMHGSSRTSGRVIVRGNVFFDNTAGVQQMGDGWQVFNNTFINDNRDVYGANSTWVGPEPAFVGVTVANVRGDVFNNIVMNHGHGALWFWGAPSGKVLDANLYFDSAGPVRFIVRPPGADRDWAFQQFLDFGAFRAQLPSNVVGREANSQVADPQFTSVPQRPAYGFTQPTPAMPRQPPALDFSNLRLALPYDARPRPQSPALGRGRSLTVATNQNPAGGTSLAVAEAGYFFDGYGVVPGDLIVIGSGLPVRVTSVDYQNRTLTLQSPRSWAAQDRVSFPFSGVAPDVGACGPTSGSVPCRVP